MEYETRLSVVELARITRLRAMFVDGSARRSRVVAGLSRGEVAAACGVTFSTVAAWEDGSKRPCTRRALKYLDLLEGLEP